MKLATRLITYVLGEGFLAKVIVALQDFIHKELKAQRGLTQTRYANVNKRVRALEELSYIERVNNRKTKAGFQASIYELRAKACLAILFASIDTNKLLVRVGESTAETILAAVLGDM